MQFWFKFCRPKNFDSPHFDYPVCSGVKPPTTSIPQLTDIISGLETGQASPCSNVTKANKIAIRIPKSFILLNFQLAQLSTVSKYPKNSLTLILNFSVERLVIE